MIAALSLMKRRSDVSVAQFRRHWLDPHGVMTAELPGLRRAEVTFESEQALVKNAGELAGKDGGNIAIYIVEDCRLV